MYTSKFQSNWCLWSFKHLWVMSDCIVNWVVLLSGLNTFLPSSTKAEGVLGFVGGHHSFFWYHQGINAWTVGLKLALATLEVSLFVSFNLFVLLGVMGLGFIWRAQYGKTRQKVLKWNFNSVTKLKLDYLNSLWRKWPNPELQKLQFKREKPQSWMCKTSLQKQGFDLFFPYY